MLLIHKFVINKYTGAEYHCYTADITVSFPVCGKFSENQARIYEDIIENKKKAREKYEELLLKTPNSIFVNKARKRYRLLRTNNLLKL